MNSKSNHFKQIIALSFQLLKHFGSFSCLKVLLASGENIEARNVVGQTPLILAALCGDRKIVEVWLS